MKTTNKILIHSNLIVASITIAILAILVLFFNIKHRYCSNKEKILQAQQANANALFVAKTMLKNHYLTNNCLNSSGCPFWSNYPRVRITMKNGKPNKTWWHANAYNIKGTTNNQKFIIIKNPHNVYKIVAFAEDLSRSNAIISVGYIIDNPK